MFSLTPWKKKANDTWAVSRKEDHPLARLREEFDDLFERIWSQWPAPFSGDWPAAQAWGSAVEETDKEVVFKADAPGFEPNELDVRVSGNLLTVRAERKQEKKENGRREWEARSFHRAFTLPAGADAAKIEARYRNGVLEIHVPRDPAAQGKRVTVTT